MFVTLEDFQYLIVLLEFRLTCFQQIMCNLPIQLVGFCLLHWPFPESFTQILQRLSSP